MKLLRLVLADDHAMVRAGIRVLLERLADVEVVGEAGDGHAALQMIAEHTPDVALLDISMPGLNGIEVTERAIKAWPGTRIILLSMHADDDYVHHALRAGAAGYLLKSSDQVELGLAVRAVAGGEAWLSPKVSKQVMAAYPRDRAAGGAFARLTPRQREILQLIAEGNSTKAISHRLAVSVKTVETHRMQLIQRLDIHEVAGLVRYAIRAGIVRAEL
jgi:DNA-binding NarL/FixJ family response regulator